MGCARPDDPRERASRPSRRVRACRRDVHHPTGAMASSSGRRVPVRRAARDHRRRRARSRGQCSSVERRDTLAARRRRLSMVYPACVPFYTLRWTTTSPTALRKRWLEYSPRASASTRSRSRVESLSGASATGRAHAAASPRGDCAPARRAICCARSAPRAATRREVGRSSATGGSPSSGTHDFAEAGMLGDVAVLSTGSCSQQGHRGHLSAARIALRGGLPRRGKCFCGNGSGGQGTYGSDQLVEFQNG